MEVEPEKWRECYRGCSRDDILIVARICGNHLPEDLSEVAKPKTG